MNNIYTTKQDSRPQLVPTRDPEIPTALKTLDESLINLQSTMESLWEKLRPVCRQDPTGPLQGSPPSDSSSAPLALELHAKAQTIRGLTARIQELHNTIEL